PRMSTAWIRTRGGAPPALPVLFFASAMCVLLLGLRDLFSGHWRYLFLPWNLFLAWLPLLFARMSCRIDESGRARGWKFPAAALAWLIFPPTRPFLNPHLY